MSDRTIRLATRKSELAMVQTGEVIRKLSAKHGGYTFEAHPVVSEGDRILDRPLSEVGGKDLFVKSLEAEMSEGAAEAAVHSLKDVGAQMDPRFMIAGTLERADPRDVLVSRSGAKLETLPAGSAVGTSSPRRAALVRHLRPDLRVVPVRGNVRTRLEKLESGVDALVLAAAGLERLGLQSLAAQHLEPSRFVPSPGQGTIAIECETGNEEMVALAKSVSSEAAMAVSRCERAVAHRLGASCHTALGAFATLEGNEINLLTFLANPSTGDIITASGGGDAARPEEIGERAAQELLDRGGRAIIDGNDISPTNGA